VRLLVIAALVLLSSCGPAPTPTKTDPTQEAWYGAATEQLAALDREAEGALAHGDSNKAAAAITSGVSLETRLLTASRPTLAATEAMSDLDRLYGRMLLMNRHYGWARLMFQKNLARWRTWRPETPESARRLQQAKDDIAECDRYLP
jgi:hypothetical protein